MLGPPPYALVVPAFSFRALAGLAGRAPLGGARETALAALVGARLAVGMAPPLELPRTLRIARADAARLWMSSVALPAPVRIAIASLLDASTTDNPAALAAALGKVGDVAAPHLDRAARLELDRLAARLRG